MEDTFFWAEGEASVSVVVLRGRGAAPYPLKATHWHRAVRLVAGHGVEGSLRRMDARAERAIERGDLATCLAWRELMVAVHAFASMDRQSYDAIH